jgi:hypothetical protein
LIRRPAWLLVLCLTAACLQPARPTPAPITATASAQPTARPTAVPTATATRTPAPSPTPANTPTPEPSPTPNDPVTHLPYVSTADPVLIAAGDVATCAGSGDEATAALIEAMTGTVAMLGDSAYDRGTAQQFADCYDPSWGRFKDRTRPVPGNHEYLTTGASAYFDYFGTAAGEPGKGYYSYDLGAWHIVAINGICWEAGGCGADAPQTQWLRADLAANPAQCTLAYWHTPRFSSGPHGNQTAVQALWDALYAAGADVVLGGHDHDYERFAPQDPQGAADPERGLREFVVGTGGAPLYTFTGDPQPNSEARNGQTFGVLRLTLRAAGYDWEFVPAAGATFTDAGSGACHSALALSLAPGPLESTKTHEGTQKSQ